MKPLFDLVEDAHNVSGPSREAVALLRRLVALRERELQDLRRDLYAAEARLVARCN
ncbi:MAG: hypothetical protein JWN04_4040 [Myxococcaceae bacterium]|nr:hypothetical protein [Myxococcaceae bacterium]